MQKGGPTVRPPFCYNTDMKKCIFILVFALGLCACGTSYKRHMNEVFAHYVERVHVSCEEDSQCVAVMKSCRYPKWGYVAINRMELADFNRVREADWYTRCKKQPDTSHTKAVCRQNRCEVAEQ